MDPVIAIRMSPELAQWVSEYAKGSDRSSLIRELLEALRQRRLYVSSEPAPYIPNDGSDPSNPILVCLNPKGEVK